jgi:hypothetical protein
MGKKSKEIKKLNEELSKTPDDMKGYSKSAVKNPNAVSGSLKTMSGPSMYGYMYNHKNISGPNMMTDKDPMSKMPTLNPFNKKELGLKEIESREMDDYKPSENNQKPYNKVKTAYLTADKKLTDIEGKHPGTKDMLRGLAIGALETGVSQVASLIADKRYREEQARNRFSAKEGSRGYSSQKK